MTNKLTIILFCFFTIIGFGQKAKFHTIKLLPNKDEPVESVNFYISEVIDNRVYKDNIGIAQKGIFNKKVLSVFNKPFEEEIFNYMNSVFSKEVSKKPIILRINQLLISENTGAFKETGKATISLDVLSKSDNDYYLLGNFSAYAEKNSADVTGKHDDRIRAILVDCILQYQDNKQKNNNRKPRLISLDTSKEPAILKNEISKGFFNTFHEFYNNNSFLDTSIKFNERSSQSKLYLEDRSHKRALYYAYYDGETVFLNAASYSGEKHFVKTEFIDHFLLFNDAFVHQDDAVGMSMAFGVLGILATNKKSHVLLDLYTGQFHVLKENRIKILLRNHRNLYENYKENRNDISVMKRILKVLFDKEDKENLRRNLRVL